MKFLKLWQTGIADETPDQMQSHRKSLKCAARILIRSDSMAQT